MKKSMICFFALLVSIAGLAVSCDKEASPPEVSLSVSRFHPLSARAGETVVISGSHFGADPADNKVTINEIPVSVVAASENELEIVVPDNIACSGPLTVTVGGRSYTAYSPFTFLRGDWVYVGGSDSRDLICWGNGQRLLVDEAGSVPVPPSLSDLVVVNSNVYAVGSASLGSCTVATLWKNGERTYLGSAPNFSQANGVCVTGQDVYVAGNEQTSSWVPIATYWKNGEKHPLCDEQSFSDAAAVAVRGSDVYVTGYMNNGTLDQAVLWVNGIKTLLDGGDNARAGGLSVDGTDLYVLGSSSDNATQLLFWKNGVKTLWDGGNEEVRVSSIFVSDGDVYLAGCEVKAGVEVAAVWKNGTKQTLGDGQKASWVSRVFVVGENVYAAGTEGQTVALWKNGEPVSLPGRTAGSSSATGLYVVPGD